MNIVIERGLLSKKQTFHSPIALITDDTVLELHGRAFFSQLDNAHLFSFPAGEPHKTRETKALLEDQMFAKKLGRDTTVIALGGGVVTDLAGFVAATYCRGVPLVTIPTTLMCMVDAAIGGKNGVNHPCGKNLIGTFHLPQQVLIDPLLLTTLPHIELKQGIVEMIKHGLIADSAYFDFLEKHLDQLLAYDLDYLEEAIRGSCRIKTDIVEQDPQETGLRRLLNFGHTVGHALEKLSNYTLPHGEAVAHGLLVESALSPLPPADLKRIEQLLARLNFKPPSFSHEELTLAMTLDKKSLRGRPRFVLLEAIGSPLPFGGAYCTKVDEFQ